MTRAQRTGQGRSFVLLGPVALAVLVLACAGAADSPKEVALAVRACSEVGVTADLAACEARVREANEFCARLDGREAASCDTYVDGLWAAAVEAYHLEHGECDALTSDQARSLCRSVNPVSLTGPTAPSAPTTTETPAPAANPSAPREEDDRGGNAGRGNNGGSGRDKEKERKDEQRD